ncbi:Hypothetical predicted protein [Pelobates cultripes]|uniref:Uncharacterized protein n=1 Tax=Pelobates cultripes TaxID=61616 RepID=A0AAD1R6D0_PELCU|nr:Hypothetical predicted protein [Pelobates cultripes]
MELTHEVQSTLERPPLTDHNMVRKSLKSQAGVLKETRYIGTLFQKPQSQKMVAGPDLISSPHSSDLTSEGQGSSHQPQPSPELRDEGEDLAPATKRDIRQLIREMKQMFDADMNLARVPRVQASEEDITDTRQALETMGDTLHPLQSSDPAFQLRLDNMVDRNRRMNIKIRDIPDSIGLTELSHYGGYLLHCYLTPRPRNWNLTDTSESIRLNKHRLQPRGM